MAGKLGRLLVTCALLPLAATHAFAQNTAVGAGSTVAGSNATALGGSAQAVFNNATAVGASSDAL